MSFYGKFSVLCSSERILQIDQELTKLWPWLGWHPFLTHGVRCVGYFGTVRMDQSKYKHVLANISRSRYNTPAVWTKWNGARSRRVDVIAGEGSLRRHA